MQKTSIKGEVSEPRYCGSSYVLITEKCVWVSSQILEYYKLLPCIFYEKTHNYLLITLNFHFDDAVRVF
jgi:hypothetical protein